MGTHDDAYGKTVFASNHLVAMPGRTECHMLTHARIDPSISLPGDPRVLLSGHRIHGGPIELPASGKRLLGVPYYVDRLREIRCSSGHLHHIPPRLHPFEKYVAAVIGESALTTKMPSRRLYDNGVLHG
jgi:hypothetical protein